ncbi:hypothetical protein PMIN06_009655 [Paraphaeosphaeria minitans]|uniref:Uncharacterized protein n=1 Tax=Paraphaeosphaeria minitans TaxID=565426 RepID=A0A9P6G8D1_9PLEO|nr:hypothetical protein PMIN01_10959 [Paraphaeosphaeria minitans]
MVFTLSIVTAAALTSLALAQGPANCAAGVQICGTSCCNGPATAFGCENGACIPVNGSPPAISISTSVVTSVSLVTTSPAGAPTETAAPNTTVSVPIVSLSETTMVATTNVTSWSTTAYPTGNHTATSTQTGKPEPSAAAGVVRAGTGLLGAALAAALGAL